MSMCAVEWKSLGDVCYISDYVSNGSFASLRENVIYKNYPDFAVLVRFADYSNGFDESRFIYIDEHAYNFLSKSSLEGGEIIMSNVGSCGMFFRCPILNRKMSLAPNSILIKSEYIDYLFHWLGSKTGQEAIKKITSKSAMPKFNKTEFKKIQIPIPSLAKQQEIVSQLDTFTTLISNLESELDMRRKQYEHYRNQLLDFEGVEKRPLGEICDIIRGNGVQKTDFTETGVGCIHYGQIYTHYGLFADKTNKFVSNDVALKARKASKGDIIMTSTSENVEDICKCVVWCGEDDVAVSAHALILKNSLNPKFIAYCSTTYDFFNQKRSLARGAKVVEIKPEQVAKVKIPFPSPNKQQQIVEKLDAFEQLIQSLETEIKLRKQQYEYYREKLLTFEK